MSIQFKQEKGLVRIDVTASSSEYYIFLFNSSVAVGSTFTSADGLLEGPTTKTSSFFHRFFKEGASICVVVATLSDGTYTVTESEDYTVEAPFSDGIILDAESGAEVGLSFSNDGVLESGGVGLTLSNVTVPDTSNIPGLSYAIDIYKVVGAEDSDFNALSYYASDDPVFVGHKNTRIHSVSLSSESPITVYDTAKQFKANQSYAYVGFLYLVIGSAKYGGWKVGAVSGLIEQTKDVVKRGTDDLYIENEVERIVAAQNRAGFQNIATKKFPKIGNDGENGTYFYSIMICSAIGDDVVLNEENAPEDAGNQLAINLTNNLATNLKNAGIIAYTGLGEGDNADVDEDGLSSIQLSGVGVVTNQFYRYQPIIDGTIRLSLSNK